tara:strand:+ start:570 stop:1061 length:492 start_codon:yes stop_codon:yes gene_type:complete
MENLDKALNAVGISVASEIKKLAKRDGFKASGDLDKSITYRVEGNVVVVEGNKYIEAISKGIKPQNGSPAEFNEKVSRIRKWAKTKGIQPRGRNGKFIVASEHNLNKMAFAIARKIKNDGISKRFGYKGSGFLEEMEKNVIKNVTEMIAEAYKLDIIVKLKEI